MSKVSKRKKNRLATVLVCLVFAEALCAVCAIYGIVPFIWNAGISCLLFLAAVIVTIAAYTSRSEDYNGGWYDEN